MSSRPAPRPDYVPALDGLRLVCCSFVVIGHAAWGPLSGRLATFGVEVFFALSGYLITSLLLRERALRGAIDLRAFYLRRTLRIFPVYYAALAVAFGLTWALGPWFTGPFRGPSDARFFGTTLASCVLFVSNWTDAPLPSPLEVLWSVCIEEQFYLLFPLLLAWRRRATSPVVVPAIIGLGLAWVCRTWLASRGAESLYRNTLAHGDSLLLGAVLAQFTTGDGARARALIANHAGKLEALSVAASVLLLLFRGDSASPFSYWATFLASAICATAIVAALAHGRGPLARTLALRPLAWAGTLTYAGYVVHMYAVTAAFGVTNRVPLGPIATTVRVTLALALTLALAYVTHVLIERPALQLKRRLSLR